ncbi:Alpha/beta hydrolase-3 [Corchorus olitorius]|uniref:Alpha/beta hydrolase-3 n=1 Tax=Corchorus olitorius TaxID=93759 RepID=A0A1R3IFR3_9ROSI|nr:Alpha/beta hydrolase-3 [Corchorus olitorius]
MKMVSNSTEIAHEFFPSNLMFRVYKDGRVERVYKTQTIPPSNDPETGVQSKDVVSSPELGLSVRLFLPKITNPALKKIPLLIYTHGGAFCIGSPFSPHYHEYLTSLVNKANVIAVSVQYRTAPEHPLPIAYDDAWTSIKWIASHVNGDGPEPWLNEHADFEKVFLCGDSAGSNIAHNMTMRAKTDALVGVKIDGLLLMNPFFMNDKRDELIEYIFPTSNGSNDPRLNPASAVNELVGLPCSRVLVCVSEKDFLKNRGVAYYEAVKKSGWNGVIDLLEIPGEDHVFFLFKTSSQKAVDLLSQVSSFLNQAFSLT